MSAKSLSPCLHAIPAPSAHAGGSSLDVRLDALRQGERIEAASGTGEEVAAILKGSFSIEAAGEQYRLSPGEAIIIPSGAARLWTCLSAAGVLYRVINRASGIAGNAGQA